MYNLLKKIKCQTIQHPSIEVFAEYATVTSWGAINKCLVYEGDRLLLGTPVEGDLLIVTPKTESLKTLYPKYNFARYFGNHVIMDYPHQPTIDSNDWEIVTAVKGLSRELSSAMVGENWFIKILGADGMLPEEWIEHVESQSLDAIYLSELANELSHLKGISIQAAWSKSSLMQTIIPEPNRVVFSFFRFEEGGLYVSDWAAGSRRKMRNKRLQRRVSKSVVNLYPLPDCKDIVQLPMQAISKVDTWRTVSIACK